MHGGKHAAQHRELVALAVPPQRAPERPPGGVLAPHLALLYPIGRRSRQEGLVGLQIGLLERGKGLTAHVDAPEVEALGDTGVVTSGLPLVPAQPLADRLNIRLGAPDVGLMGPEGALSTRQGIGQGAVNDGD